MFHYMHAIMFHYFFFFLIFHACFSCKFASLLFCASLMYFSLPVFSVLLWDGFLMHLSGMNLKTNHMLRERLSQCQYLSIFYKMCAAAILSILLQSHRDEKVNIVRYDRTTILFPINFADLFPNSENKKCLSCPTHLL
jgi:hypothetical protein